MKPNIKIDFVSDVACPWCAVGLGNLNQAIAQLGDKARFEVHFRSFELNPNMPESGQDAIEHLTQKYRLSESQIKANQANIRMKAREAGFEFHSEGRKRVYNTFNAHRLLYWAAEEYGLNEQAALKKELLTTYFCLSVHFNEHQSLLGAVDRAALNQARATDILNSDSFSQAVRDEERTYIDLGITAVPSIVIDSQYLLQGAQPPEVFINAFEKVLSGHE